jgi:glycosyltransferase involved in cell wall biosynthesis
MDHLTPDIHHSPLRVLYLIDSLASGGAQRQLTTLVSTLNGDFVKAAVAVYQPFWHFRPEIERSGIPIYVIGDSGARDPMVTLRLAKLLYKEKFHFIHSFLRTPGILARAVSMLCRNTRVIVSERSTDLDHSWWKLMLERLLANRGDAMITNAEAIKLKVEALIPKWRGRIHIVPNGIAFTEVTEDFRCRVQEFRARYVKAADQVLVGVVARLSPEKDPDLLLEGLQKLPEKVLSQIRIVWVGSLANHSLLIQLNKRIENLGLSKSLSFVSQMRQIRIVYQAIDALALTSRREGFPNAILEAFADEKPVIATDVGDVRVLVENGINGWIVPQGDSGALAEALEKLVKIGPNHRSKMGRLGSEKVRRLYSSEKMARQTLDVYAKVCKKI